MSQSQLAHGGYQSRDPTSRKKGPMGHKSGQRGFEPRHGKPVNRISNPARSAAPPPVRKGGNVDCDDSRSVRQSLAAPASGSVGLVHRPLDSVVVFADFQFDVFRRIHGLAQSTGSAF